MEDTALPTETIVAIRSVVKEEIEAHYSAVARQLIGWVVTVFLAAIVGAFVLGGRVNELYSKTDLLDQKVNIQISNINESISDIKGALGIKK